MSVVFAAVHGPVRVTAVRVGIAGRRAIGVDGQELFGGVVDLQLFTAAETLLEATGNAVALCPTYGEQAAS